MKIINIEWKDINFFDNNFSEDIGNILFGGRISEGKPNMISPDSTSDGWLKKRWKIIGGERCLIKGGSAPFYQEPLNEALTSVICRRLHIPHVDYTVMWDGNTPYSICKDFITNKTDLVSAFQICETESINDGEDLYKHFTRCCHALGIPGVRESLDQMLAVDYLIANSDRHFGNFGAVRNAQTLQWIGMAPLFDNGTSLWCQTANAFINPEADIESMTFKKKHREQLELISSFDWLDITALNGIEKEFEEILALSPYMDEERCNFLCYALKRRVELLDEFIF